MSSGFILEPPTTRWICHLCGTEDVTKEVKAHSRMHSCPKLGGLTAPMVDIKLNCKMEINEREDYIGEEIVQTDAEGRPIMSVKTIREDGEDCVVYAPTSIARN